MRKALISLIAAGSVVAISTSVLAQDAVPTPAPAAQPTVEATTAVPAPAPVVTPQAAPVAEAPPAPPTAPTDPTTIRVQNVLETVCLPMVTGGDIAALTKPHGFKKKRDLYVLAMAKPMQITMNPPGSNKNVCSFQIMHAPGGDQPMTVALHNWALARGYSLQRNDNRTDDLKRHTRSWELTKPDGKAEALVLVTEWKPDGSSVARGADRSIVMFTSQ